MKKGGHLQRFVKKNPSSIILIDEIDKFHPKVISSLTSFFGDSFLTIPSNEERIPFRGLIYLTSNTGNKLSESCMGREIGLNLSEGKSHSEIETRRILNILKQQGIGNEFLGRINRFITFNHLGDSDIEKILDKTIIEINEKLKYYKINLTAPAKKEVLKLCDTNSFGAREISHTLNRVIISKLNYEYEMNKAISDLSVVSVNFEDGEFVH